MLQRSIPSCRDLTITVRYYCETGRCVSDSLCQMPSLLSTKTILTHQTHSVTENANNTNKYVRLLSFRGTWLSSPSGTDFRLRWRASVTRDAHTCTIRMVAHRVDKLTRLRRDPKSARCAARRSAELGSVRGGSTSQFAGSAPAFSADVFRVRYSKAVATNGPPRRPVKMPSSAQSLKRSEKPVAGQSQSGGPVVFGHGHPDEACFIFLACRDGRYRIAFVFTVFCDPG